MQMYYQNKRTIWAEIMLLLLISKSFLDFLRQKKASKGG